MNLPKVTETLQEHGISHHLIAPHVIRVTWLVDGASQPVIDFNCYTNKATVMPDFNKLGNKEAIGDAVYAIIASKRGSYLEAQSYENMLPKSFGSDGWQAAHNIVEKIEERTS